MRELPSRGRCHAVFLLAYSIRLKPAATLEGWIAASMDRATIMAAATDIRGTARILLAAGLVSVGDSVVLDERLLRVSQRADHRSLVAIARLLLSRFPPAWVVSAVVDGELRPEYVPDADLQRLAWLGCELAPIVLSVHRAITAASDARLRKQIGDAGELAVVSALERIGIAPSHVSLVSDAYGYDIEYQTGQDLQRLEVKACVPNTADRVIVSRNEYDKAAAFGSSWRLIQVCFASGIVVRKRATCADVLFIRELPASSLIALGPPSTDAFRGVEAAEFRPPHDFWNESALRVAEHFQVDFAS
ncbi:MAG: DUF3883 domain-containing protein [Rhodococcus sp.]|nr:DUF3883 domain-containing protein [Rhodococcus sp. (in: high G+C Gram-positive bacteria)]